MRRIILAAVLFLGSALAAQAQCYVGLGLGAAIASTKAEIVGTPFAADGIGSSGAIGSIRVGCDVNAPNTALWLGGFAEYSKKDVEFSVSPGIFSAKLTDAWGLGLRGGYKIGNAMPYALVKYTEQSMSWDLPGIDAPKFRGIGLGGGVEFDLGKNWTTGIEGTWTRFNSETVAGVVGLQPTELSITARMAYRF